jgi:hypothetical protein
MKMGLALANPIFIGHWARTQLGALFEKWGGVRAPLEAPID